MATENSSPKPPAARPPRWAGMRPSGARPQRLAFRLLGIPILAVAGVLIYRGVHDRFVLPECDSARAKQTLGEVLRQLKSEPLRYEPITTVSTSRDRVVCRADLPLADGATLEVEYSFFWQGNTAQMKYGISRREPRSSAVGPQSGAALLK